MEQKFWNLNYYFDNSKLLINKKMQIFLYYLIKSIFISVNKIKKNYQIDIKIKAWIEEVNKNLIKNKENYISVEYTNKNLKNILKFVKTQNELYAGEILENILIIVFSYAFDSKKENSFGKYLHNNMGLIKDKDNNDFLYWFKIDKFKQDELKRIDKLLENDILPEDKKKKKETQIQEKTVLLIFYSKFIKKNIPMKKSSN